MLIAFLLWIFEASLFILYGRLALWLLRPLCGPRRAPQSSPLLVMLAGLVMVTSLASLASLWTNLSALTLALFTLGGLLILAWEWKVDRLNSLKAFWQVPTTGKGWLLIALLLIGLVLDLSTRRAANPDTGIYHAQAIRWIETYPAVPGLGNLHTRLAFNSAWLVANAQFSLAFLGIQSFHALPGLFMAVFGWVALAGLRRISQRAARPSDWVKALLLPLAFFTIATESSSPGTDFPAILLVWFVLIEWMAEQEQPGQDAYRPALIALVAVFAVTVKLSVAPVVLFAAFIFLRYLRARMFRLAGAILLGGALILLPWCARNVVLSGYLVYPEPAVDLFNPDWKIPAQVAAAEKTVIQAWARIPREEKTIVQAMPLATWAKIWYFNHDKSDQALFWGVGLGPLTAALAWLASRKVRAALKGQVRRHALAYAVFYAGLAFWFFSAPDLRFGSGFVLGALVLGWLPWLILAQPLTAHWGKPIAGALLVITLILWGLQIRSIEPRTLPLRLLLPKDYTSLSTAPCALNNKTIFCAEWYNECGYHAFPCVPSADPQVGLRGADYRDGFRNFGP